MPPVTTGMSQVYVVPAGTIPLLTLNGVAVNDPPLHIVEVMSVIEGRGFTVTVTVKLVPVQLPERGVTVYTADWALFPGLTRLPVTESPEPAAPPVIPPVTTGADQE